MNIQAKFTNGSDSSCSYIVTISINHAKLSNYSFAILASHSSNHYHLYNYCHLLWIINLFIILK